MSNIKYISKAQSHADETTNYWFEVSGESFAVSECGSEVHLLNSEGKPYNMSDSGPKELLAQLIVTDRMRNDY